MATMPSVIILRQCWKIGGCCNQCADEREAMAEGTDQEETDSEQDVVPRCRLFQPMFTQLFWAPDSQQDDAHKTQSSNKLGRVIKCTQEVKKKKTP